MAMDAKSAAVLLLAQFAEIEVVAFDIPEPATLVCEHFLRENGKLDHSGTAVIYVDYSARRFYLDNKDVFTMTYSDQTIIGRRSSEREKLAPGFDRWEQYILIDRFTGDFKFYFG